MSTKSLIKRFIHKLGYDLYRLNPNINPRYQLLKGLERFDINVVFDIGANTGQFASELRSVGFNGNIVSFEPLSDAYTRLNIEASKDPKWIVHNRCAIGDADGKIDINIAGNSVSSSVLPMLSSHSSAAIGSEYVGSELVPISKFDSIYAQYLRKENKYFIKIDTQGYEWEVLDGASNALKQASGLLCELSLVPLSTLR